MLFYSLPPLREPRRHASASQPLAQAQPQADGAGATPDTGDTADVGDSVDPIRVEQSSS